MTTVVKLMPRSLLASKNLRIPCSVCSSFFSLLIPRTGDGTGKRGKNINKAKELAAERTKYCSLVTLETPCLRKQAPGSSLLVSSMKEGYEETCALYRGNVSSVWNISSKQAYVWF